MRSIKLNNNDIDSEIAGRSSVLLDFYADECGACRRMLPVIDEIAGEREDIFVARIDTDAEPELARRFGVSGIPTFIAMRNGTEVKRAYGAMSKERLLALLSEE